MTKYSIVIPTYNRCDDLLKPCIESILQYTDMSNVEIVVVANGCTDGTRHYVEELQQRLPGHIKLVWIDQASGYTISTNAGIRECAGEYIILLNNDTMLTGQPTNQWIDMLEAPFKQDSNMGLVGPVVGKDTNSGHDFIIFFCVMIARKVFDKIGLLDEIFSPGGYEDSDFTIRAADAGFAFAQAGEKSWAGDDPANAAKRTVWVGNFPIFHKDNQTLGTTGYYGDALKKNALTICKRHNKDIRLNLGSGSMRLPGYIGVDLLDDRADLRMDVTKLEFDDNTVSEILASHVFEHLNPYRATDILREWHRALKPGGKIALELPDILEHCRMFVEGDLQQRYRMLNGIYGSLNTDGSDPYTAGIKSPHLFGWWPESISEHLHNAGFVNITVGPEQIPHPGWPCFRVEAYKPAVPTIDHKKLREVDRYLYDEIWGYDSYSSRKEEVEGRVVLDIGANRGFFALKCVEYGAKKIVAIEAQANVYQTLVDTTRGFPTIFPRFAAVWSEAGKILTLEDKGGSSRITTGTGSPVTTVTLESLINEFPDDKLVLKIDVEGAEYDILLNTDSDLLRRFETVYIEIHTHENENPKYRDPRLIRRYLAHAGFKQMNVLPIVMNYFENDKLVSVEELGAYVEKWVRV